MSMRTLARAVFFALLCVPWQVLDSAAQRSALERPESPDGFIPITLVMTNHGGSPALFRRAGAEHQNLILVDATVDAQQLSDAVFSLLIFEARDPGGHERADKAAQRSRLDRVHPIYSWADYALHRLRTAEKQRIRGMGEHRAVQIWMRPVRLARTSPPLQ